MNNKKDLEFERILAELEDPKNIGIGSWALPANPTPAEKIKYDICQKILLYQENLDLSDDELARKTHLTISELEDILFCRISKFSLDNLINISNQIFSFEEIKLNVLEESKIIHNVEKR